MGFRRGYGALGIRIGASSRSVSYGMLGGYNGYGVCRVIRRLSLATGQRCGANPVITTVILQLKSEIG